MNDNITIFWLSVACGGSLGMLFYLVIHKWLTPDWEYGGMINEHDYYDPYDLDDYEYFMDSDRRRANIQAVVDFYLQQRAEDQANQIDYVKRWWGE
jgi:hypothetical protein